MNRLNIVIMLIAFTLSISACRNKEIPAGERSQDPEGWKLAWSDEFNYTGLPDSGSWAYDTGGHGWGNNERQYYTALRSENARVEDGLLIIEARRESRDTNKFTSARLITRDKHEWLYGRFEIRAKLPKGTGTWPAIWMLAAEKSYGDDYWPHNGEIDIMEHVGFHQGYIHASTHSLKYYWQVGTQRTDTIFSNDVSDAFHNYILEWDKEQIRIFMDDSLYFTSLNEHTGWEAWPFDKPFYLIMNIAVGGTWGGQQGVDETIWPQRMEVDYVRVYEKI